MSDPLANLARIGQLKIQACDLAETQRMLTQARLRWADAQLPHVSVTRKGTLPSTKAIWTLKKAW